jgi:hypothetical protein
MPSLKEQLATSDKRAQVIQDACRVLDEEVADKGGITGLAIKGGYKLVQGIRPGFVRDVVDHLLDEFFDAMDPIYQEARAKGRPAGLYLNENKGRVAEGLLGVTDRRAAESTNNVLKKAYEKLRPMAKSQVEAAIPRLAVLLEKHAAPTQ